MTVHRWRCSDWDSAYGNYQYSVGEYMDGVAKISLVVADKNNWLAVDEFDSHFDREFVDGVLSDIPDLVNRLITNNMHLCRNIDKRDSDQAELEHKHERALARLQTKINKLQKELDMAKALLRGEAKNEA